MKPWAGCNFFTRNQREGVFQKDPYARNKKEAAERRLRDGLDEMSVAHAHTRARHAAKGTGISCDFQEPAAYRWNPG